MAVRKLLGGLALAALVGWTLLVLAALAGVGVESQLPGSDWQIPGLVTALALLVGLAVYAALGRPWQDTHTPYW
jgi:hypothetical protein